MLALALAIYMYFLFLYFDAPFEKNFQIPKTNSNPIAEMEVKGGIAFLQKY